MNVSFSNEPRHKKTRFLPMRKQAKLISAFVFATRIVHFLFLLNPKFQVSMLLLGLYQTVFWFVSDLVGNPEDRFSRVAAH